MRRDVETFDLLLRSETDAVLERSLLRHQCCRFLAIGVSDIANLDSGSGRRMKELAKEDKYSSKVVVPAGSVPQRCCEKGPLVAKVLRKNVDLGGRRII